MIRSLDTNLVSKKSKLGCIWKWKKKSWKKNWKFVLDFFFFFWFFLLSLNELKVRRPERKTSGFQTIRILKICRTSGPDVMSGRALLLWLLPFYLYLQNWKLITIRRDSFPMKMAESACYHFCSYFRISLYAYQIFSS